MNQRSSARDTLAEQMIKKNVRRTNGIRTFGHSESIMSAPVSVDLNATLKRNQHNDEAHN